MIGLLRCFSSKRNRKVEDDERIMEIQYYRERKEGKSCITYDRVFLSYYLSPTAGVTHTVHFIFISYAWNLKGEKSFVI